MAFAILEMRRHAQLRSWRCGVTLSDTTFVFLCTTAMLMAVACAIWFLVPHGTPVPKAVARQIVTEPLATYLTPKPHERYTYLALIAFTPPIIGLFVWLRRVCPGSSKAPNGLPPVLLTVAALICAIPHDEARARFLSGPTTAPLWFTIALCLAIAGWTGVNWTAVAKWRPRRLASSVLYGLSITVIGAWRVYGTPTYARDVTAHHFEAVLYSIAQISLGATCLHDVVPQYGCYGEFLAVPLRLTGLSVTSVLVVLALLEAVAMVAIIRFARSLIKDPLVLLACGLWLVIVTNQVFWIAQPDIYVQYWPVRILFPALSLAVAQSWPRHPSRLRAFGAGLFSAAAVFWNLDSGVIVFVSLGAFLLSSGITARFPVTRRLLENAAYVVFYLIGFIVFSSAFYGFLAGKAGAWIDLTRYVIFQKTFYTTGFFMLPMLPLPDMWLVAACLPLGPLIFVALRVGTGPTSARLERAAYLAVLSIGVFGYFTGRSHPIVFGLVSWPFVVLAFFLIDRHMSCRSPRAKFSRVFMRLVSAAGLVTAATLIFAQTGRVVGIATERWSDMTASRSASAIDADVAFIKHSIEPYETVGVLAFDQAALIAGVGQRSAIDGTGIMETIRKQDADAIVDQLVSRGPRHLFINHNLISRSSVYFLPWLIGSIENIAAAYVLTGWGPEGRLMHLERCERLGAADSFSTPLAALPQRAAPQPTGGSKRVAAGGPCPAAETRSDHDMPSG